MEKPKMVIADPSEDFRYALAQELGDSFHIYLCENGYETADALVSVAPDFFILDPTVSGIEGLTLLQQATQLDNPPVILVASGFLSDYVLDTLSQMGISYVIRKPCDIRCARERILDLSRHRQNVPDARTQLTTLLLYLGFPPKRQGYTYLMEGILQLLQNPEQSLTKELYPYLAALHRSDSRAVETAIRNAITATWATRDKRLWAKYFPLYTEDTVKRPSNANFLKSMVTAIQNNLAIQLIQ